MSCRESDAYISPKIRFSYSDLLLMIVAPFCYSLDLDVGNKSNLKALLP